MSLFKSKQEEQRADSEKKGTVSFFLSEKEYAVDIGLVREVIYGKKINPLPGSPDYFEGLIDLRGTVIPVIHLGKKLHAVPSGPSERNGETGLFEHILIVEVHRKQVGFVVDRVQEVMVIEKETVQPAQNLIELPLPVIDGIFRYKDRLIVLLSLDRLFTAATIQQMTDVIRQDAA